MPQNPFFSIGLHDSIQPVRLTGDTWDGIHAFQVFDGNVSWSQAQADAHRYNYVWGSDKPKAWVGGNQSIVTSYYAPFDGDFTAKNNLQWWQKNHPSWVLYKCDKRTPASLDGLKNVPLDFSNSAVMKWQLTTYAPVMVNGGYQALAADLVGLENSTGGCGVWVSGVWQQRFTGQKIDDTWAKAVIAWHAYAMHFLHGYSTPLMLGVNHVPENRPYKDPEEEQLINNFDFIADESSFTDYGNSYAPYSKVVVTLEWMKYIQGLGKPWIDIDKWNTSQMSHQQFEWALGTYLLGKQHYASVYINHNPGYGYEYWYSQYNANVGSPCGDFYEDPLNKGILYRKYTHAFIAINASSSTTFKIQLPLPTYTDLYGHTVTSPISLTAENGQVLLTSNNGCL